MGIAYLGPGGGGGYIGQVMPQASGMRTFLLFFFFLREHLNQKIKIRKVFG